MSDRRIDMIAKAAGYWSAEYGCIDGAPPAWSPERNVADAASLALRIGLRITPYPIYTEPKHSVLVSKDELPGEENDDDWDRAESIIAFNNNPEAALCKAVCDVAEKIGRGMK